MVHGGLVYPQFQKNQSRYTLLLASEWAANLTMVGLGDGDGPVIASCWGGQGLPTLPPTDRPPSQVWSDAADGRVYV